MLNLFMASAFYFFSFSLLVHPFSSLGFLLPFLLCFYVKLLLNLLELPANIRFIPVYTRFTVFEFDQFELLWIYHLCIFAVTWREPRLADRNMAHVHWDRETSIHTLAFELDALKAIRIEPHKEGVSIDDKARESEIDHWEPMESPAKLSSRFLGIQYRKLVQVLANAKLFVKFTLSFIATGKELESFPIFWIRFFLRFFSCSGLCKTYKYLVVVPSFILNSQSPWIENHDERTSSFKLGSRAMPSSRSSNCGLSHTVRHISFW